MFERNASWKELDSNRVCRREQRAILLENQSDCCAWCEQGVNLDDSHIDHIESRHDKPQRSFDHLNVVASCGKTRGQHCGHARSSASLPNQFDLYLASNIQQNFRVSADGTLVVEATDLNAQQVSVFENAINKELNLNCRVLKAKRSRRLADIESMLSGDVEPSDLAEVFFDFPSITDQVYKGL